MIHLIGGRVQATLLAETAYAAGATILAGPREATVAGDMPCQLITTGGVAVSSKDAPLCAAR